MWSYPNIFRDQGRKGLQGDGKEVCDLLVVFENHLIIFSDKDCEFPSGENIALNWARWCRKAIVKSASQVFGAERWLLDQPDRIFLDKACKVKFPLALPPKEKASVHRMVVTHGISDHCKKFFGGNSSGSLVFNPRLTGDDHTNVDRCIPFTYGHIAPEKGLVHVLDDTSLQVLMSTLDTITDFVDYLSAKEKLLMGDVGIMALGEEEMLASYMFNTTDEGRHTFSIPPDTSLYVFGEGEWDKFQASPKRANQLKANEVSYLWDHIIEKFVGHIFSGTSEYLSHTDLSDQEKAFRLLAKENRTRRRLLGQALLEVVDRTSENQRATRTVLPMEDGEPCYVFLVLPRRNTDDETQYRTVRRELLAQYCFITKLRVPNAKMIVGIATEPGSSSQRSEDLGLYDASAWGPEDKKKAEELESNLKANGLLADRNWSRGLTYEFPPTAGPLNYRPVKGRDRNKPCFCNSGKKFKNCCGRHT